MKATARIAMTGAMAAANARPASCAPRAMRKFVARMTYQRQGNLSTRCRARARRPAAPRCSCALPAAICGAGWRRIAREAVCKFCDTDFVGTDGPGGGKFADAAALARAVAAQWPGHADGKPYVVCTGGEPLLQLDEALIAALHDEGFEIGIETNGTLAAAAGHRLDLRQPQGGCASRNSRAATN